MPINNGVSIPGGFNGATNPAFSNVPPTGLIGFEQAIRGGTGAALGELDVGNRGLENQAALAGLRGNEAQAGAFDNFQSSPGQQFLLDQSEKALTRNASATGGLSGGNLLQELQRNAIGLAAQDFGNSFQRGQQVLGSQQGAAGNAAGLISSAGNNLADARFSTGQQIASSAGGTTSALANLQNQLGAGQSNILGQGATNLGNLVSGTGQQSSQLNQQLATILANIGTGTGSALASPIQAAAQFDAAGTLGQNSAIQNSLQQLIQLNSGQNSTTTGGGSQIGASTGSFGPNGQL